MNTLHLPPARWGPIRIRPPEDFAATPPPPAYAAAQHPPALVQTLVGRYCAGMAGRSSGTAVHAALLGGAPARTPDANPTIAWLLRSCAPPDALRLIARAQVPVPALAAYVRELRIDNPRLVRMLNQFAWPPPTPGAAKQLAR